MPDAILRAAGLTFADLFPPNSAEAFSAEELGALLATAEKEMPEAYPLVLTLARTGLRIGEALTLQVDDLDFGRRELWVRRTWGSRKKALGDRRMTVDIYGHLVPGANKEAVDRLDDATTRNLPATGRPSPEAAGEPVRAQVPDKTVRLYHRPG